MSFKCLEFSLKKEVGKFLFHNHTWVDAASVPPLALTLKIGALGCGRGRSGRHRLSAARWKAGPGDGPGIWADPDFIVMILPEPGPAL